MLDVSRFWDGVAAAVLYDALLRAEYDARDRRPDDNGYDIDVCWSCSAEGGRKGPIQHERDCVFAPVNEGWTAPAPVDGVPAAPSAP